MQWSALFALVFSGFATVGFGASAPMGDVPASTHFDTPLFPWVSTRPVVFIPIHMP